MKPIQSLKSAADDTPYLVQYHEYDPRLPDVFEKLTSLVRSALGSASVEHIGSSSIPGVGGRNVLDIAIPTAESKQAELRQKLCDLGFEESPFPHYLPLLVGQIEYENTNFEILLYIVPPDSSVLADWIAFRDYMRSHPADARAYDATKQEAIAGGRVGGEDYQAAKNPFLADISVKLGRIGA